MRAFFIAFARRITAWIRSSGSSIPSGTLSGSIEIWLPAEPFSPAGRAFTGTSRRAKRFFTGSRCAAT